MAGAPADQDKPRKGQAHIEKGSVGTIPKERSSAGFLGATQQVISFRVRYTEQVKHPNGNVKEVDRLAAVEMPGLWFQGFVDLNDTVKVDGKWKDGILIAKTINN